MSADDTTGAVIIVNGEERPFPGDGEISSLLTDLGVRGDRKGVAIAVNGELVPRQEWDNVRLAAGDQVELVRPVQGG